MDGWYWYVALYKGKYPDKYYIVDGDDFSSLQAHFSYLCGRICELPLCGVTYSVQVELRHK